MELRTGKVMGAEDVYASGVFNGKVVAEVQGTPGRHHATVSKNDKMVAGAQGTSCRQHATVAKSIPLSNYDNYDNHQSDNRLNFRKCGKLRCKAFCPKFNSSCTVKSSNTGRIHDCVNKEYPRIVNCHSQNVIYCITCRRCSVQYVGQTAVKINVRFCTHRQCMKGSTNAKSCLKLANHFSSGECEGADYEVNIFENWEGNGHKDDGTMDWELDRLRKKREDEWMLSLRTIYPYGLNDSLNFPEDFQFSKTGSIGKVFPAFPCSKSRQGHPIHCHRANHTEYKMFLSKTNH